MGSNQSVHMANATEQDIYVIASRNPDWAIADVITDVGLLLVGIGEIKAAVTAAKLPAAITSARELYQLVRIAAQLVSGSITVGTRPVEAALAVVDAVKKKSIRIAPKECKEIKDEGLLGMYLNVSGIAGQFNASTVSVIVMSGDGKQTAMFHTGPDYSWIATEDKTVERARFGTLWVRDPGAGKVAWGIGTEESL